MRPRLFRLRPEVAGGFGKQTQLEFDETGSLARVIHLDYEFAGWLGDDLLATTPCFIVSDRLQEAMRQSDLSGASFEPITVSKSDEFMEMYGDRQLPSFVRLVPLGAVGLTATGEVGQWSGDDFCLMGRNKLVVTEHVLRLLSAFNISHCEVEELK